ncbi:MAG: DHA2 family efflux MFS transporter permease subunit [Propionibacteriaceae bacterium]
MSDTTGSTIDARLIRLMAVLVFGGLLALLTTTIVGVGIPALADEFGATLDQLEWVSTAYVLAVASAIPLSGWATIRYGVRTTWLTALGVFTLGSLLAAVAPSLPALIGFRVVQGLGAGMLEPVMLTAIASAAGPARMGRVMGVVSGAMGIGPLIGPVLGGVIVAGLDWRWMFGAFVPLGLLAMAVSWRGLPRTHQAGARLDWLGLLLLAVGSAALLYALSKTTAPGGLGVGGWLAVPMGLAALVAYLLHARRLGESAVVSLTPFRSRGFLPAATVMFVVGAAIYPLFFGLPQFFQGVMGLAPLQSGLLLIPHGAGALVGMVLGGRLSDRFNTTVLVAVGAVASGAGVIPYLISVPGSSLLPLVAGSLLTGLGLGLVGGPAVSSMYRSLEPALIPSGTSVLFVFNQLGGAIGIATLSSLIGADAWSTAVGTTPLWLPLVASVVVLALSLRLRSAQGVPTRRRVSVG